MITLTITYDEKSGRMDVRGPTKNKLLSVGLLELAKGLIVAEPVSDPNLVAIANGAALDVVKARQNGHPQ